MGCPGHLHPSSLMRGRADVAGLAVHRMLLLPRSMCQREQWWDMIHLLASLLDPRFPFSGLAVWGEYLRPMAVTLVRKRDSSYLWPV